MERENIIEDKVSFRYYLEHNHDFVESTKNYGCVHNGVNYGAGMIAVEMNILNIYQNNTQVIANKKFHNGTLNFKGMLAQFVQYCANIDEVFERMLAYRTDRQFKVYSEKEYLEEKKYLEKHSNNSKSDVFRDKNEKEYISRSKKISTLSEEELLKKYEKEKSKKSSKQMGTKSSPYKRSEVVSELAKRRAHGICELSDMNGNYHKAPFDVDGTPYLESHHVEWLSHGGEDVLENVVALCPNCHKKIHILNEMVDNQKLLNRLKLYANKMNETSKKDAE